MLCPVRWLLFDRRANTIPSRPVHDGLSTHAVEWRNLGVCHVDNEVLKLLQSRLPTDTPIHGSTGHAAVILSVPPRPRNLHHISALGALAPLRDAVHSSFPEVLLSARWRTVYMAFTSRGKENLTSPTANLWASVGGGSALVGAVLGLASL